MELQKVAGTARGGVGRTKAVILCALFAGLTAVGTFIRVPLPVIPFTLQFFFVSLAGLLLGPRLGALSQVVFLLLGIVGFPVFTKGGGIGYVFEPTFGYILGFALNAWVAGKCMEKLRACTVKNVFLSCAAGTLTAYACGVVYMYGILRFYLGQPMTLAAAVWTGALVFAPKDLLLCLATALICRRLLPALKRAGHME